MPAYLTADIREEINTICEALRVGSNELYRKACDKISSGTTQ